LAVIIAAGFLFTPERRAVGDAPPVGVVAAQASIRPLGEVKATIDDLVKVVQQFSGGNQVAERRDHMLKIVRPRFDFREMSMRSLGEKWPTLSQQEQKEFTDVFSDLLASTYLKRIENIQAGMVQFKDENVRGSRAQVRTVVHYQDDVFPIEYRLLLEDGQWRVYDVIIENIGLVQNYRHEFAGIIRREKFTGLMQRLREKAVK
jgi:phospholipid transport system substrate-binding protein